MLAFIALLLSSLYATGSALGNTFSMQKSVSVLPRFGEVLAKTPEFQAAIKNIKEDRSVFNSVVRAKGDYFPVFNDFLLKYPFPKFHSF